MMKNPPHPGLTLRDDVLPALGLSVTQAAEQLGVSRVALSRVLNAHAAISPALALRLEAWLGVERGGAARLWRLALAQDRLQLAAAPGQRTTLGLTLSASAAFSASAPTIDNKTASHIPCLTSLPISSWRPAPKSCSAGFMCIFGLSNLGIGEGDIT